MSRAGIIAIVLVGAAVLGGAFVVIKRQKHEVVSIPLAAFAQRDIPGGELVAPVPASMPISNKPVRHAHSISGFVDVAGCGSMPTPRFEASGVSEEARRLRVMPVLNLDGGWQVLMCDQQTHECFDGASLMWYTER